MVEIMAKQPVMSCIDASIMRCLKRFCLGLAIFAGLSVTKIRCLGQQSGEPAPPAAALSSDARAQRFLQDVAKLSPVPAATDPDRAQAWPRSPIRNFRLPDGTEGGRTSRVLNPIVLNYPVENALKYRPVWTVEYYGGEIRVIVDAVTGNVLGYIDASLMNAICRDPASADSDCISKDAALSRALSYLSAADLRMDNLILASVRLVDSGEPATESSRTWELTFRKTWQGVTFDNQSLNLSLDARLGRLISFGAATGMPPPTEARLEVAEQRAGEVATQFITSLGYTPNAELQTELLIVQPNNYWTSPRFPAGDTEQAQYTRLAWVVRIPIKRPETPTQYFADIRVDTVTGEVIGGDLGASMGKNPPLVYGGRIGSKLRAAKRLEANRLLPKKMGAAKVVGYPQSLDPRSAPLRFYGAIAGIRSLSPGMERKIFSSTHRLSVTLDRDQTVAFDYDEGQGLIRSVDGEIAQAGPGMRAWLNSPARPRASGDNAGDKQHGVGVRHHER